MLFELFAKLDPLPEHTQYAVIHGLKLGIEGLIAIPPTVESINRGTESALLGLEIPRPSIHIVTVSPIVVKSVSDFLVDGRHGFHVAFTPLPAQILGLQFKQLEY